ncbi:MAG: copper oxidase [Planctomycetes bacterium]|nr:copper oxidase [Planctomycetota bacterium]
MITRRDFVTTGLAVGGATLVGLQRASAQDAPPIVRPKSNESPPQGDSSFTGVVTPNGASLPHVMRDGVKEFHIVAEACVREFAPGMEVKCWGYNGQTPGPTIECNEGDHVRLFVTNHLPEHTTIHWHGIFLPSGMDGVGGLNQPHIRPGETYVYEFTLRQHGTFMYHPHADEMVQMAVGMMGLFIVHPKHPRKNQIQRDFAIMLHNWQVNPGTYRPDPSIMVEFNMWTFNSRVFPGTDHLVVRTVDRVRIRFGNLSMWNHPIHVHGHAWKIVATDGGEIQEAGQWPETTVLVPVGSTRDVEFIADAPGDWALHCHMSHHTMNAMGHAIPNTLGVDQRGVAEKIRSLLPGYMAMGESGMAEHQDHAMQMAGPKNTLPMMTGKGQFGNIEMGGMFTVLKVRDGITSYEDPGWYAFPAGSVARRVG